MHQTASAYGQRTDMFCRDDVSPACLITTPAGIILIIRATVRVLSLPSGRPEGTTAGTAVTLQQSATACWVYDRLVLAPLTAEHSLYTFAQFVRTCVRVRVCVLVCMCAFVTVGTHACTGLTLQSLPILSHTFLVLAICPTLLFEVDH